MHIYVPDNLAPNPPILVTLHYCGGNAGNVFSLSQQGGIVTAADQNGFILLLPQTSRNCWDVATADALTNGGGSDTLSIVHQVEYTISEYGGNADRVYVIGTSGGAMGAQGLAAVYPDVFKGAVEFSGVPAGCWAVGNMTDGQWSSACAGGQVTHTEQEWGDMVRDMYPGYDGFRPRIQLWHGDADSTISFVNHTEAIKQWRNVLGLPEAPTSTSSVMVNGRTFNREEWQDECGTTVLDVMTEPNGPHNTSANMTGQYSMSFLSLDVAGDTDPQAASECGTPGGDPAGGGASSGGASSGGASSGGMPGEGTAGMGVMPENGGAPAAGGMPAPMGMAGAGNPTDPVPSGTVTPAPGATATGSASGAPPTGVAPTSSGSAPVPGATSAPPTPAGSSPSPAGAGGTSGTGSLGAAGADTMLGDPPPADDGGCACKLQKQSRPVNALALAGLFVAAFARRRSKR